MPKRSRDNPLDWTDVEQLLWSISLDGGPEREVGSSSEGAGWAGLMQNLTRQELVEWMVREEGYGPAKSLDRWLRELGVPAKFGVILQENTDGIRTVRLYTNQKELRDDFAVLMFDLEGDTDWEIGGDRVQRAWERKHLGRERNPSRTIAEIAREIRSLAISPKRQSLPLYAMPYVEAMERLGTLRDSFGHDSAEEVVLRFLSNASAWRGEDARRIKAELRAMLARTNPEGGWGRPAEQEEVEWTTDIDAARRWRDFDRARQWAAQNLRGRFHAWRITDAGLVAGTPVGWSDMVYVVHIPGGGKNGQDIYVA